MLAFTERRRTSSELSGFTQHMLTVQLCELEADGLVSQTVFAELLPSVEYEISSKARALGPTTQALIEWWAEHGGSAPMASPVSSGREPKS